MIWSHLVIISLKAWFYIEASKLFFFAIWIEKHSHYQNYRHNFQYCSTRNISVNSYEYLPWKLAWTKPLLSPYWLKHNRPEETLKISIFYWLELTIVKSAIWHKWKFMGWYTQVPYGTVGQERVSSLIFHSNLCAFPEVLKRSIFKQSRVSWVHDHFLHSHDLKVRFKDNTVGRN